MMCTAFPSSVHPPVFSKRTLQANKKRTVAKRGVLEIDVAVVGAKVKG